MKDEVLYANEVAEELEVKGEVICMLAKLMGMPKLGGSYRFTSMHVKKLKAIIEIIRDTGKLINDP